jgi:pimeloyl-ACP methyl ester carboxylesterase
MWITGEPDDTVLAQLCSAAKAWLANGEYEKPGPPAFDHLGSITAPAVLLIGDQDYPPLIECDEAIAARIPGCRKIDVPGGDHLLPLRVPDLVADTIEEFAG